MRTAPVCRWLAAQVRRLMKQVEALEHPEHAVKVKSVAVQAEMIAELDRQRTEGERLAVEAAQCVAAGKAAVKEAERFAAEEAAPARLGTCTVHPSHECGFRDDTLVLAMRSLVDGQSTPLEAERPMRGPQRRLEAESCTVFLEGTRRKHENGTLTTVPKPLSIPIIKDPYNNRYRLWMIPGALQLWRER